MDTYVWSVELPPEKGSNYIAVDYVINDLGIFAKTEQRSKKSGTTAQLWGFRAGKNKVKGTDYLAQIQGRQALLWQKVTEVIPGDQQITVRGNSQTEIVIFCSPENFSDAMDMIGQMIGSHPTEKGPSLDAAGWLCWEQDEDWEAGESLEEMVEAERNGAERFIEDEILADTVLR
jgi:hypothetical protein